MSQIGGAAFPAIHSHVFLSEDHQKSERKTWAVIWPVQRDDGRRNCRWLVVWIDCARCRRTSHEHPCRRPIARGARLHLLSEIRG